MALRNKETAYNNWLKCLKETLVYGIIQEWSDERRTKQPEQTGRPPKFGKGDIMRLRNKVCQVDSQEMEDYTLLRLYSSDESTFRQFHICKTWHVCPRDEKDDSKYKNPM